MTARPDRGPRSTWLGHFDLLYEEAAQALASRDMEQKQLLGPITTEVKPAPLLGGRARAREGSWDERHRRPSPAHCPGPQKKPAS